MELNDFSDLSGFIYSEYEKMSDAFGLSKTPDKSVKFVEKSIRKYTKLYDTPLYQKEKREIELKTAFDTMPHSWLWKLFHSKLWAKMKKIMQEQERREVEPAKIEPEKPPEKPDILVPAVIVPHEIVVSETVSNTAEFDSDFE